MTTPFAVPLDEQFTQAPLIGSILIGLLVSAGWIMTDPKWTQSSSGDGMMGSAQSWMTMAIVFVVAAIIGFFGVKWWVENV